LRRSDGNGFSFYRFRLWSEEVKSTNAATEEYPLTATMAVRLVSATTSSAAPQCNSFRWFFVLLTTMVAMISMVSMMQSSRSIVSDLFDHPEVLWKVAVASGIVKEEDLQTMPLPQSDVPSPKRKPHQPLNILVLYPDDWRHDSLQDAQPGKVFTPFLTELASEGIRFARNAVTSSICWLSRATLFTGQYVSRHNAQRLYCSTFTAPEYWKHSWPARLQQAGYFTGHIGKWQYWNSKNFSRDAWNFSSMHEGRHWQPPTMFVRGNDLSNYTERRGKHNDQIPAADLCKEEAIHFLRNERPPDRPFALSVAFYPPKPVGESREPGGQWDPSEKYKRLYENVTYTRPYNVTQAFQALPPGLFKMSENRNWQRWRSDEHFQQGMKNYMALISNVDEASREIIQELKRQGLYESTLIIFTCDNGMMLGHHGLGGKWHPFEESIRVPLIIRDPRMPLDMRGTVDNEHFTLNIDLAETILSAAGLPPSPYMQGRDIADLYLGEAEHITDTMVGKIANPSLSRTGPWRQDFFYDFPLSDITASTSLVTKNYKYVAYQRRSGGVIEQLFDLQSDPYELNDIIENVSGILLNQLQERYRQVKEEARNNDGVEVPKCQKWHYA
jgi:arylsulfatase A-like enzyme